MIGTCHDVTYLVFDRAHIVYLFQHRAVLGHPLDPVVGDPRTSCIDEVVVGDDDVLVRVQLAAHLTVRWWCGEMGRGVMRCDKV